MNLSFWRIPLDGSPPITNPWAAGQPPHRGVDYGVITGTPVYAPADGTVVNFTNNGDFGKGVCLYHQVDDGPWYSLYAHLSQIDVGMGQPVRGGQRLGLSGNTGMSTGPHLHWQLCRTSTFPVNPVYSANPYDYLEEELTPIEKAMLLQAHKAYIALCAKNDAILDAWNEGGNSLLLGYAGEQQKLADHIDNHPSGEGLPPGTTFTAEIT